MAAPREKIRGFLSLGNYSPYTLKNTAMASS